MNERSITILQLYPRDMNIYGDNGNVLVLKKRLEWHGFTPIVVGYNPDDPFPDGIDIVVGGGGQDSGQGKIQDDLLQIGPTLQNLAQAGTPMLVICGLYQLFGHFFETQDGTRIEGISIFDAETYGKSERLIGNIVTHSEEFGNIVGYENHSGQTFLRGDTKPLAMVKTGAGNNTLDKHEGARKYNVIGSYLHGSLLPKNPKIADWMIAEAAKRKYGEFTPRNIDDHIAKAARRIAMKRPR